MAVKPNINPAVDSFDDVADTVNVMLKAIGDHGVVNSFEIVTLGTYTDFNVIEVEGYIANWEATPAGPLGRTVFHKTGVITPGSAGTGTPFEWYDAIGNQFVISTDQTLNPFMVGAVGDNIADDSAAFALIESSSFNDIELPEGFTFNITSGPLLKSYYGKGLINRNATIYNFDYFGPDKELKAQDLNVAGNAVIDGDLTVNGTTTTIDTENLVIEDNIITVNNGEVGAGVTAVTAGIEIDRGSLDNAQLVFDESDDRWKVSTDAGATLQTLATSAEAIAGAVLDRFINGFWVNATTSVDVRIVTRGACSDSTGTVMMSKNTSSNVFIQTNGTWTDSPTGGGGMPSALTVAANTWYRVFVITDDGTNLRYGLDTSATAANLMADATGYNYYRRIGWVRTNGSSALLATEFFPGSNFTEYRDVRLPDVDEGLGQVITSTVGGSTTITLTSPPLTTAHTFALIDATADSAYTVYVEFWGAGGSSTDRATGKSFSLHAGRFNTAWIFSNSSVLLLNLSTTSSVNARKSNSASTVLLGVRGWTDERINP